MDGTHTTLLNNTELVKTNVGFGVRVYFTTQRADVRYVDVQVGVLALINCPQIPQKKTLIWS